MTNEGLYRSKFQSSDLDSHTFYNGAVRKHADKFAGALHFWGTYLQAYVSRTHSNKAPAGDLSFRPRFVQSKVGAGSCFSGPEKSRVNGQQVPKSLLWKHTFISLSHHSKFKVNTSFCHADVLFLKPCPHAP